MTYQSNAQPPEGIIRIITARHIRELKRNQHFSVLSAGPIFTKANPQNLQISVPHIVVAGRNLQQPFTADLEIIPPDPQSDAFLQVDEAARACVTVRMKFLEVSTNSWYSTFQMLVMGKWQDLTQRRNPKMASPSRKLIFKSVQIQNLTKWMRLKIGYPQILW